ncbi:sulfurtransferase, partial [bacterium]|nr:sulfurtransferase [bacterium]
MRKEDAELIAPEALAAELGRPGLRLVDATWIAPAQGLDPRASHAEARLPGAVFFDIDRVATPSGDVPHMLPDAETFAAGVGALGIGPEDHVVVYDQSGVASAASRAWWTFLHFGQRRVSLLDGGLPAWRAARLPVETGRAAPAAVDRPATPGRL